jgi:hypothetical protein
MIKMNTFEAAKRAKIVSSFAADSSMTVLPLIVSGIALASCVNPSASSSGCCSVICIAFETSYSYINT